MKNYASVFILGAASGVMTSCGGGLTAYELRAMDMIGPPRPATIASDAELKQTYFDLPERVTSCLAFGQTHFPASFATSEVGHLELDGMNCDACTARVTIDLPAPTLDSLRMRYVFGYLTLTDASDGTLRNLPSICSESWIKASSHAPVCYWERLSPNVRRSGVFGVSLTGTEAHIANLNLEKKFDPNQKERSVERLAAFNTSLTIDPDITGGALVSFFYGLAGQVGFVPLAVEAVQANDGASLGCLPVSG